MQYKVPQHIDEEDKILGPLTFVQFIYLLLGGGLLLLCFVLFDLALFILLAIPIAFFTLAFSLIKIQDQPFSRFFLAFLIYLIQPKKRLWHDLTIETTKESFSLRNSRPVPTQRPTSRPEKNPGLRSASQNPVPPTTPSTPPKTPARRIPVTLIGGAQ